MPFNQKPQKFNAKINAVTIGNGDQDCDNRRRKFFPVLHL